jgi:fucose 4-O-acetylase-like acetyltransferase
VAAKIHFDEIDIVKGIAILFVMWHHSFIQYPIYMLDIPWVKYAVAIHPTFYLTVFFLVSGYLFANSRPGLSWRISRRRRADY